ncbi:glycosyltransferase [Nocardioides speluncae]|uniref:glycosyltransferase n=1 Tax=Nocardioides speluncae TaxID=2670337 RepID=UPI000D69D9A9|nr:glycosyltransferase [Nocardioides speluncae]
MAEREHEISVVVPVYRGASTLPALVTELAAWTEPFVTPGGHRARVAEVLLVHDCGPDDSDRVLRELADAHDWVRPVWLSRNFGQHPATMAGMSSSGGDWVATLDEDGQHDPAYLPALLDRAMADRADVVYAAPTNPPPHGPLRNAASHGAKWLVRTVGGTAAAEQFHSYRLVLGVIARSVAAYAGPRVYLDVALTWLTDRVTTCPVELRDDSQRPSGYRLRTLASHFWRLLLTSGTRPLRIVSLSGVLMAGLGFLLAGWVVGVRLLGDVGEQGWASVMVAILIGIGMVLFALGVVAEYVGVAVSMAMGRPHFLVVGDRADGPHGPDPAQGPAARAADRAAGR